MSEGQTRVLLVDDEPLIRWAVAETLTARGCGIVEASDAQSAIAAIGDGSRRFDVVVLDYRLPDGHDLTLLETVRRLSPESQVVVMTAFIAEDVARRALELGACHVLQKPVELGALAALVLKAAREGSAPLRQRAGNRISPAGDGLAQFFEPEHRDRKG